MATTENYQVPGDLPTGADAPPSTHAGDRPAERPAWLPEKFKTPEDLAKSYKELESKLGQSKKPEPPAPVKAAEGKAPEDSLAIPPADARKAVENAGLSMDKYDAEFNENGGLSEESYQELAAKGFSKDLVDQHIEGRVAKGKLAEMDAHAITGGAEGYTAMTTWAQENLPSEDIEQFNELVNNPKTRAFAVKALHAQFTAAEGREPNLVGGRGTTQGPAGYRSMAEQKADQRDPRYKNDPAFQQYVEDRIKRSSGY